MNDSVLERYLLDIRVEIVKLSNRIAAIEEIYLRHIDPQSDK